MPLGKLTVDSTGKPSSKLALAMRASFDHTAETRIQFDWILPRPSVIKEKNSFNFGNIIFLKYNFKRFLYW